MHAADGGRRAGARLVRRLMHILTTRTRSGVLYEIDTRLRPSGRSGLMVTSVDAFERYQREEAWTWEHQALLRARPVGGSQRVSDAFGEVRARVLTQNVRLETLANDVVSMRSRMRRELDRSTGDRFDLKQGKGGIGDIEFIVQYLALSVAADHPGAIEWSDNIRQLDALAADGVVESETAVRLQDIYREYRRLVHQRVLNAEDRIVDADALQEERRFVSDTWNRVFAGFDGMDAGDD